MKIKDIPGFKALVMSMLPVTQAEIWKELGISSKDGSELIGYLLNEKIIKRTTIKINGKRTFLLESANGNGHAKRTDYTVLLSGGRFSMLRMRSGLHARRLYAIDRMDSHSITPYDVRGLYNFFKTILQNVSSYNAFPVSLCFVLMPLLKY
jgi:DNA-binding Lrp family transcriptional regulator